MWVFEISPLFSNIFVVVFGLLVGSFLNVVIARLPIRESLVTPPSHCPKCQNQIRWWDNIPVLSYLLLRGQCRQCKTKISIRYPLIELLTAFLFLAASIRFGVTPLLFFRDLPFLALLICITFIDLEHRLIPDSLSLGGLVLGLVTSFFTPGFGIQTALIGAGVGFGFFYAVAWFYVWRTGQSGLGGGDIKLLAMLGSFIGVFGVLTTILVSSVLGSIMGLVWAWSQKSKNAVDPVTGSSDSLMKVSIPYGPFLVIGALYYYLLGDILWSPFTSLM
jgi:leader peptidase (prepilin peptidase)/N-methyltransferase